MPCYPALLKLLDTAGRTLILSEHTAYFSRAAPPRFDKKNGGLPWVEPASSRIVGVHVQPVCPGGSPQPAKAGL